jgi:hypothetical protein
MPAEIVVMLGVVGHRNPSNAVSVSSRGGRDLTPGRCALGALGDPPELARLGDRCLKGVRTELAHCRGVQDVPNTAHQGAHVRLIVGQR